MRVGVKRSLFVFLLILCGFSWFWWNISTQKLSNFLEYQIKIQSGGAYQADVVEASTGFFAIHIKSLELYDNRGNKQVDLEKISFSLAPWNLLLGNLRLDAEAYQGEITLKFDAVKSILYFEFNNVLLNYNPIIRKFGIFNGNPVLTGSGQFPVGNELSLNAKFQLREVVLNAKGLNASSPIPLPNLKLSEMMLTLELVKQQLKIDLQTTGDVTASLQGEVTQINWAQPRFSMVNLILQATVQPAIKAKLGFAAELLSMYQNAAGKIRLRLTGKLSAPNIEKL